MKKKFLLHINIIIALFFVVPVVQAQEKTFTVVIDPGHGGRDPGARGATIDEKVINLAVSLKLGKLISDNYKDVKVIYTRKTDVFVELDERANIANRNKADLFISIHANAVRKRSSVSGTETFTLGLARTEENLEVAMRENSAILLEEDYLQKYEGFDPNSSESYIIFEFMQNKHMEQSVSLASEIQKAFKTENRIDRGVKQAGLLVLRKTSMPSVLVELGFMTNRDEERFMKSADGQNKLSKAVYEAFAKYKREYDKRLGLPAASGTPLASNASPKTEVKHETEKVSPLPSPAVSREREPVVKNNSGEVVYKVQVLTSAKKLSPNDRLLKGYKNIDYYVDNGAYKYTVGETKSKEEVNNLWNKLRKDFRGAFIIEVQDGKRIK